MAYGTPAAVLSILVNASTGGASASLTKLDRKLAGSAKRAEVSSARIASAAKYAGLGIAAALGGSVYAAGSFESAFAEVEKTVDTNQKGFKSIEKGLRSLATEIPVSANELANLAGEAGALGVKSKAIVGFTKTASMLGTTTDLAATDASNALARLANIMDSDGRKAFERMGSTLVDLGNKGASTESEISDMALRIAGAGKTLGLSEAQVLGLSSALANVGIEAEMGGSAISRVMLQMQDAIARGGPELANFAQIAGMSANQFAASFGKSAPDAIAQFAGGLGEMNKAGESTMEVLDGVNLNEIRVRDTLLRIAGNTKQFTDAQHVANRAWEDNNALSAEARKRYDTFFSQLTLLKNEIVETGIGIGQQLLPDLKDMIGILRNPKLTLGEKLEQIGEKLGNMIAEWGPKVAEAAGTLGVAMARGLWRAFNDAPFWAQLAGGAWFLNKLGGASLFRSSGSRMGKLFAGAFILAWEAEKVWDIINGEKLDAPETENKITELSGAGWRKLQVQGPGRVSGVSPLGGRSIFKFQNGEWKEIQKDANVFADKLSKIRDRAYDAVLKGEPSAIQKMLGKVDAAPWVSKAQPEVQAAMSNLRALLVGELDKQNKQAFKKLAELADGGDKATRRLKQQVVRNTGQMVGEVLGGFDSLGGGAENALKQLGAKPINWKALARDPNGASLGRQRGGPIPGAGDGDKVPAMLEPGEYVLNKKLTKALGRPMLDLWNHSAVPRFAKGGAVSGETAGLVPGFLGALTSMAGATGTPINVNSGLRTRAEQARLYAMYLAGTGNLAAPPGSSRHESGVAADIAPGRSVFGGVAGKYGMGFPVPSEDWHIELLGKGMKGATSGAIPKLARIILSGEKGPLRDLGQAGLDKVLKAARAKIAKGYGAMGGPPGNIKVPGGQFSKSELMRLWSQTGPNGSASLMAAIALAESGGNPGVTNSIGARGLWQIMPATAAGFGFDYSKMTDPRWNATAAHAILKGQGLGAWEAYTNGAYRQFLRRGGAVLPSLDTGGRVTKSGLAEVHPGDVHMGKPEIHVKVFVGDREITDIVRTEIRDGDRHKKRLARSGMVA